MMAFPYWKSTKPFFFIPFIDPIIWILLMIFIRPFYQIRCFQFRWIKEIGFKRISTFDLTPNEFQNCKRDAVIFCKNNNIEQFCRTSIKIDDCTIDLTSHYAKEAAKEITDFFIASAILGKTNQKGIFVLPKEICNKSFSEKIITKFQINTGLVYKKLFLLTSFHKNVLFVISYLIQMFHIIKYFFQNLNKNNVDISDKIIYYDLAPSHMNLDPDKKLSATFIIDGQKIKKENIIYFSNDKDKSDLWRNKNFNVYKNFSELYSTKDLLLGCVTFIKKSSILYKSNLNSKNILMFLRLIISNELLIRKRIKGFIYTVSSGLKEPTESLLLNALKIPTLMYSYSASSFYGPHWCYLSCEHLFVWNNNMKNFINDHPQLKDIDIRISGPLMMGEDYLSKEMINISKKEIQSKLKNTNSFLIGIFDVAPHNEKLLENARLSITYTREFHKKFMFDIFDLLSKIKNLRFVIKPKRWTKYHDIEDAVMGYIENNKKIVKLDPEINPYLAVQSCDLIICMAFTSIYYAAQQKRIPAIFYSPLITKELQHNKKLNDQLIVGKIDLENKVNDIISDKKKGLISEDIYENQISFNKNTSVRRSFINQLSEIFEA